ncbi:unnamed protein product [Penicillium olsonii]|uniref:Inner kinetochore subunit AME1 domain-containing protein n=1 Tax=Penicillium olsonii TaxID=99116 RepID=A0A9W4MPG8_PENOL|nr:unnamed protein product [Penicillium olsonii]
MEGSREERQQMRQRGAGTRKAKEVDFGFAFGSPLAQPPAPAPLAIVPEPKNVPQTQPAPAIPQPSEASQPISPPPAAARTPGSARNNLPERPSTYDIASDERGEQTRSNKRRKLSSQPASDQLIGGESGLRSENGDLQSPNGNANNVGLQRSPIPDVSDTNIQKQQENPETEPLQDPIISHPETSIQDQHQGNHESDANGSEPATQSATATDTEQPTRIESPIAETSGDNAAIREAPPPGTSSKSPQPQDQTEALQLESTESKGSDRRSSQAPPEDERPGAPVVEQRNEPGKEAVQREGPSGELKDSHILPVAANARVADDLRGSRNEAQQEHQQSTQEPSAKPKKPRSRLPRKTPAQSSYPPAETTAQQPDAELQNESESTQGETVSKAKRTNGGPAIGEKTDAAKPDQTSSQADPETVDVPPGPRRGRKKASEKPTHQPEPVESAAQKPQRDRPGKRPNRSLEPEEPQTERQPEAEAHDAAAVPESRRGRPGKKPKHAVVPEPEPEQEPEPQHEASTFNQPEPEAETAAPKSRRGRSGKGKRTAESEPVPEPEQPEEEQQPEPQPEPSIIDQPEPETETAAPKSRRGRPGKVKRTAESEPVPGPSEPEPEQEPEPQPGTSTSDQHEPEAETTAPKSRRARSGKTKRTANPKPVPEPEEPEEEPQPEPSAIDQPEIETETAAPKSRRGKPGKAKRAAERESGPEVEGEPNPESEAGQEQPRRKTREPRGETVPVTVYRLANVTSLGNTTSTADAPGGGQDSADELTSDKRTKIPSRGGVNPADVLSQICRETLDKTLNTLKDGIEKETNTARRAEWSRKKKAVEIFGSELDSRLMDLSGMLDSNFVLGVQLKKTKREMMDLRGQLYRVRRERESVALQMDAVRSNHAEEEKAKTSRNTISNSLHSLELALERNRQRPGPTAESTPDLEFMLRTVADISARAPGGQGGLLNQIRSFNAQLEATVSRLER